MSAEHTRPLETWLQLQMRDQLPRGHALQLSGQAAKNSDFSDLSDNEGQPGSARAQQRVNLQAAKNIEAAFRAKLQQGVSHALRFCGIHAEGL